MKLSKKFSILSACVLLRIIFDISAIPRKLLIWKVQDCKFGRDCFQSIIILSMCNVICNVKLLNF